MAEHTPTPWRVDHRANTRVVAGKDDTIAATGCQSSIRDDWEANAAFIVRAVNSHDELIRAVDVLKANARVQAKLLADTARQRDDLVGALRTLDTLLDFGDTLSDNVWTFEDLTAIQAAFDRAKAALDQVTGDHVGSVQVSGGSHD